MGPLPRAIGWGRLHRLDFISILTGEPHLLDCDVAFHEIVPVYPYSASSKLDGRGESVFTASDASGMQSMYLSSWTRSTVLILMNRRPIDGRYVRARFVFRRGW